VSAALKPRCEGSAHATKPNDSDPHRRLSILRALANDL
jgi:hypothetical protein